MRYVNHLQDVPVKKCTYNVGFDFFVETILFDTWGPSMQIAKIIKIELLNYHVLTKSSLVQIPLK